MLNSAGMDAQFERSRCSISRGILRKGDPLLAGAVAVSDKVSGGWPSGAEQPCRAQHEALCDGQEELAVCQYAGRRTGQQRDLQLD